MTSLKNLSIIIWTMSLLLLTSCSEINTSDADKTYSYWAKDLIPHDVEVVNGKYWESAHWTKEYVVYMELKPSREWWTKFAEAYDFKSKRIDKIDVDKSEIFSIDDPDWIKKPDWFKPSLESEVYEQFGGCKYFWNPKDGILFVYEIQL